MRLWIPEDERRPTPPPVETDDRTPILVGLGLWLLATLGLLSALPALTASGNGDWLWIGVCGLGIGLVLLAYTLIRRR
tara:strand:+ start:1159 stop:1392 length:234 start_codon:yes stop_codon:yes gene_type:complete